MVRVVGKLVAQVLRLESSAALAMTPERSLQ